ncbi:MAG: chromate transporter [Oscillospiraceae bacterium]
MIIYLELFLTFLKIGAFTFGGGYAMLPLIQTEVLNKGWMTMAELVNFIAVSESTPGPFAVNISTYVGATTAGPLGAFCATLGVVLPSFVIILLVAKFFTAFRKSKIVDGCMSGLKPAVIGMIASAAVSVGATAFFPNSFDVSYLLSYGFICSAVIFLLMLFLEYKKLHPILIITLSAVLGIATGYAPRVIEALSNV